MTKEEALLDNIPNNCIWEDKLVNCPQIYVYQSMDEYAKQQTISFAEYLAMRGWGMCDLNGPHSGKWVSDMNIQYGFKTIQQLYDEFLNTLTPKP